MVETKQERRRAPQRQPGVVPAREALTHSAYRNSSCPSSASFRPAHSWLLPIIRLSMVQHRSAAVPPPCIIIFIFFALFARCLHCDSTSSHGGEEARKTWSGSILGPDWTSVVFTDHRSDRSPEAKPNTLIQRGRVFNSFLTQCKLLCALCTHTDCKIVLYFNFG